MIPLLSGNALKLIAALAMLADHAGILLFPAATWLRVVGRLAFPIFAFMIAEGCRYTRSRARYLGGILALGVACQVVYFVALRDTYLSILITFSLAIATTYTLQWAKERGTPLAWGAFVAAVVAVWAANQLLTIDYGFFGCMTPVAASAFMPRRGTALSPRADALDRLPLHLAMMALPLIGLALSYGGRQWFSLAALLPLALYSGKRGKWRMKWFFYIFYPAHLALLNGIAWLLA